MVAGDIVSRKTVPWIVAGFIAGTLQVVDFIFVSGGAGHGNVHPYAGAIFFGVCSLLWFLLPPFQFAFYAYLACKRLKKLGIVAAILHYSSTVMLIGFYSSREVSTEVVSRMDELIAVYGPFAILNVLFFVRILSAGKQA